MSGRISTTRSISRNTSQKRKSPTTRAETSRTIRRNPDTIFLNAEVVTLDSGRPRARALAIEDGRVTKIGTDQELRSISRGQVQLWNLDGATVLPGFTDCHTHLVSYGIELFGANLRKSTSISEIQNSLRRQSQVTKAGGWVLGYGWDQEKLCERGFPSRLDLDAVVPDKPVCIFRVCEHVCVANSVALRLSGITRTTQPPAGGIIDCDNETGEPTGVLKENAMSLVCTQIPEFDDQQLRKAVLMALHKAVSAGLTSIHCILDDCHHLRILHAMNQARELRARIYVLIPDEWLDSVSKIGISTGFGDAMLKIQAIKAFTDGSLGARTAALEDPYADSPDTRGVQTHSQDELSAIIEKASRMGFQVAIHAIGDHAIAMALTAIEYAKLAIPESTTLRHRIEHASVLTPELITRIKRAQVIASVQPHFIPSDSWIPTRVGRERAKFVYPLRSLLKSGAHVVGGSDCPVEPIAPLEGISAAVNSATGDYGERVEIQDALEMFTKNAAYATHEEKTKGMIREGSVADLVVLDRNPLRIPPSEVHKIRVLATVVGGRLMYTSGKFRAMKSPHERDPQARRRSRIHSLSSRQTGHQRPLRRP